MVKLNPDVVRRLVASVDWGYTNPGTLLVWAVDGDGRMYLVHEVYRCRRTIDWWVEQAVAAVRHFGDMPVVCDPAEPAYISAFQQAGLNAFGGFNDIERGIDAVKVRLRPAGDGRPRLFLSRDALAEQDPVLLAAKKPTCTAAEFDAYVYPKGQDGKPNKETPVDDCNHGLDALRYAVAYVDGLPDGPLEMYGAAPIVV